MRNRIAVESWAKRKPVSHQHLSRIRTAPRAALLKGDLEREGEREGRERRGRRGMRGWRGNRGTGGGGSDEVVQRGREERMGFPLRNIPEHWASPSQSSCVGGRSGGVGWGWGWWGFWRQICVHSCVRGRPWMCNAWANVWSKGAKQGTPLPSLFVVPDGVSNSCEWSSLNKLVFT